MIFKIIGKYTNLASHNPKAALFFAERPTHRAVDGIFFLDEGSVLYSHTEENRRFVWSARNNEWFSDIGLAAIETPGYWSGNSEYFIKHDVVAILI